MENEKDEPVPYMSVELDGVVVEHCNNYRGVHLHRNINEIHLDTRKWEIDYGEHTNIIHIFPK